MIPDSLPLVANHLWQSTLFAGLAGLLALALRKNPARVRHWVWVAASIKFLIPFSVLIAFGGNIGWRAGSSVAPAYVPVVMEQFSQPFTAATDSSLILNGRLPAPNWLPATLWTMWACGFIGISISWWIRWRRIRAAVNAGSTLHFGLSIPAISSPSFLEPGIFGVFRPVLLVPEGIFGNLTPEQWKTIVAHELCHVRRRDNLVGIIQMFVETAFWFYPLVWWIGKRIFQERELSCDEEVLRLGSEPRTYAQGILKVCELSLESPLPCVAGVTGANLQHRIETIMKNRAAVGLNGIGKIVLAVAATAALTLPIAVGVIHLQPIHAQGPKFEVISVKPNPVLSGTMFQEFKATPTVHLTGNRFTQRQTTVQYLLMQAYGVWDYQIAGLPEWAQAPNGEHYDVEATIAGDKTPPAEQLQSMLQSLLADRFALTLHHATKEEPVYALSPAKGGPKLQEVSGDPRSGSTMRQLINLLSHVVGRPIIDKTGLPASYDTTALNKLSWGKLGEQHRADPLSVPEALEGALEDQFGLKLELKKEPIDELVIDHIEKPTAN